MRKEEKWNKKGWKKKKKKIQKKKKLKSEKEIGGKRGKIKWRSWEMKSKTWKVVEGYGSMKGER